MRIVLTLLLLLASLPLRAADEVVEDPAAAVVDDTEESTAPLSEAEQAAAIEAELAAAETAAAATPAGTLAEEPPVGNENFVPSVQISEDLSVSFPVDI